MDELLTLGVILLAFLGGEDDEKKPPDRDPFCPPGPQGQIFVWDAVNRRCVPFTPGTPEPPETPDEPAPDPKVPGEWIRDDWPKDGRIFQVTSGWQFLGTGAKRVAFNAITDAAYRAAIEHGQTHAQALEFASDRGHTGSNRMAYFQAIQCDPFNDALYGTYGYGPQAMPASSGRAIRMLPQHADNRTRMLNGEQLIRSIRLRTPNDQGKGNGTAAGGAPSGHFEALWLPEIDREHLWTTGQIRVSKSGPPKVIKDLGWANRSGPLPGNIVWGC